MLPDTLILDNLTLGLLLMLAFLIVLILLGSIVDRISSRRYMRETNSRVHMVDQNGSKI